MDCMGNVQNEMDEGNMWILNLRPQSICLISMQIHIEQATRSLSPLQNQQISDKNSKLLIQLAYLEEGECEL